MKVLVLGANGQLGTDLCHVLRARGHEVVEVRHRELEVCDATAVGRLLAAARPEMVINTAAFHQVETCESSPERAFAINAVAARNVAAACRDQGAAVVFFSTDYVFSGAGTRAWRETDPAAPVNVYGASKAAGEMLVAAACGEHYVLRVSGLFGTAGSSGKGGNFVETMLRKASAGESLRVVNDQVLSPTYTGHLAGAVADLMATRAYGLYHLSAAGACSWHEFAAAIFRLQGITVDLTPVPTAAISSPVRRPPNSVLDKSRFNSLGLPPLPSWEAGLRDYLAARAPSAQLARGTQSAMP